MWLLLGVCIGAPCGAVALAVWWLRMTAKHNYIDMALTIKILRDKLIKAEEVAEKIFELERRLDGR